VEPLPGLNTLAPLALWLIIPPYVVPTPPVYQVLGATAWKGTPKHRTLTQIEENVNLEIEGLVNCKERKRFSVNSLLTSAQLTEPRLEGLARHLEEAFPDRWRISGSGAVHFVIPDPVMTLEQARVQLHAFQDPLRIVATETRSS